MTGRRKARASWKEQEELQERLKEAELMVAKLKLETSTSLWQSRSAQVETSSSSGRSQYRRKRREAAPRSHTQDSSTRKPPPAESCNSNHESSTSYESCKELESSGEEPCPMFDRFVQLGVDWIGPKEDRREKEDTARTKQELNT